MRMWWPWFSSLYYHLHIEISVGVCLLTILSPKVTLGYISTLSGTTKLFNLILYYSFCFNLCRAIICQQNKDT